MFIGINNEINFTRYDQNPIYNLILFSRCAPRIRYDDRMLIKHNVSQMNQTNSIYQVILKNFTNQINNEILISNHNFRVSLIFDTMANLIDVNSLLGIPNMNINSISLLIKMQKLNQLTIDYKLNQLN